MCSDPDSKPPIAPTAGTSVVGRRLELTASDGNCFSAYRADASDPTGAGVLVLPDYYGLTGFYEELTLRFAEIGIDAVAIDYYGRTARTAPRDASFDHVSHADRTTWTGLQADAGTAAAELRSSRDISALFSIGFCFGGRTSFLLGTLPELRMAGVIGFYGWPVGAISNATPAPVDVADRFTAPLLGIFGGADSKITSEDAAVFEDGLLAAGADHKIVSYEGAPHSFFDRKHSDFAGASADAWAEVRTFIDTHTGMRSRA